MAICVIDRMYNCVQVAIMFITKGDMPHERSWASWLSAAKWLVPPAYANVEFSSSESMLPKQTWRQSSEQKTGMQHYKEQALFNMYVHAPPNHTGYAPETVFRDRDINDRVQVDFVCLLGTGKPLTLRTHTHK